MTEEQEPGAPSRVEAAAALAALAGVVVAIVTAGVRGALRGWYPIGDNALLALRARDVLTEHHPLLGTWTSASLTVGTPINNPGPLYFDLLAPFARIGPGAVAVGVAVLNALAVVLIAAFARRLGGARLVAVSMVATAGIAFAMGSELLFDPWQPHSLLVPFLALLVLAASIAAGDHAALPWAAGVGSIVVQTHLSYAVLVPGLLVAALVWGGVGLRRRLRDPLESRGARRRVRRSVLVALVVGLACWAQPLYEQVARDGNLEAIATHAGGGDVLVGPESGVRVVGSVVGDPSGWLRSSFETTFGPDPLGERIVEGGPPNAGVRSFSGALASLLLVAALVGAAAVVAARRKDRAGLGVAAVGAVSVVLALATTSSLPVSDAFGISPHQMRFLWPIAAFAVVVPLGTLLPRHRAVTFGAAVLALAGAAATLPSANVEAGPSADVAAQGAVRDVADQVAAWPGDEVLFFDGRTVPFAEPFSGPVLLELARVGVDFEVDDEFSYQVGPRRRGPADASARLRFVVGADATSVPPSARILAVRSGLTENEQRELDDLQTELARALADGELRLGERGVEARARGLLPEVEVDGWERDVGVLLDGGGAGLLATLVEHRYADPASLPSGAARWAELQRRLGRYSVAVLVEPLDP